MSILAFLSTPRSADERRQFLQALERYIFIAMLTNIRYIHRELLIWHRQEDELRNIWKKSSSIDKIVKEINEKADAMLEVSKIFIDDATAVSGRNFYTWKLIRYFLFEYNLDLQEKSKSERPKIFWPEFSEPPTDFISVEHIFPRQARHAYWRSRFGRLKQKQREALRDSLGNLLPLSKAKNASLSNKPFDEKVEGLGGSVVGYRFGSYAENEVAREGDWTPEKILSRGIMMLRFMERRWNIQMGDDIKKKRILGLDFMHLDQAEIREGSGRKGRRARSAA